MTGTELAVGAVVYLVACTVQGSIGFGANLIAVPILAQVNPDFVPGMTLMMNPVLGALGTWRERGHTDSEALTWTLVGRLPGIVLGVVVLSLVSEDRIGVLFAILLLVAVALQVSGLSLARRRATLLGAGTVSGFMGTSVGVGGPPVALILADLPGPAFRATMSPYFLIGTALSLVALSIGDQFGMEQFTNALFLLPAVYIGFLVSGPLRSRIDHGRMATSVYVLSAFAAIVLLVRSLV